jgi:hypothetical protein
MVIELLARHTRDDVTAMAEAGISPIETEVLVVANVVQSLLD